MAHLVTLAKLRGLARLYADQRPGGADAFVPDTDGGNDDTGSVNDLIRLAVAEFWDLLTAARAHEYSRLESLLSLVSGTAVYPLPSDFYEVLSVVLEWSPNDQEVVRPIDRVRGRPMFSNFGMWGPRSPKGFRIYGSNIEFLPTPTSVPPYTRLYYIPTAPALASDLDTVDCVNGWEKLPALRVAMELRAIEEMPFTDLERLFDRERSRIIEMASERQAASPKQVQDVCPEGGTGFRRFPMGNPWDETFDPSFG